MKIIEKMPYFEKFNYEVRLDFDRENKKYFPRIYKDSAEIFCDDESYFPYWTKNSDVAVVVGKSLIVANFSDDERRNISIQNIWDFADDVRATLAYSAVDEGEYLRADSFISFALDYLIQDYMTEGRE